MIYKGNSVRNREFWSAYQPGFRFANAPAGSRKFFEEVSAYRYSTEPHIGDVARFHRWTGCDVLEAGCGIGTDGARFAAAGARYTGVDFSTPALSLARRRFELEDLEGTFLAGSVTALPFRDETFDLVFSHGVIHHVNDTEAAVREFHRVLKPSGTVIAMVYHRRSFNYYVSIMTVRRMLAGFLLLPRSAELISRLTGDPVEVVAGHRELLSKYGSRYIRDRSLFLSNNTDGPHNPLSKVYSRTDVRELFGRFFPNVATRVCYLNLRLYRGGGRFAATRLASRVERRIGWHLYVEAQKKECEDIPAGRQKPNSFHRSRGRDVLGP